MDVACLSMLRGILNPLPSEVQGFKFGCSCSECLMGFICPTTALSLRRAARHTNHALESGEFHEGFSEGNYDVVGTARKNLKYAYRLLLLNLP